MGDPSGANAGCLMEKWELDARECIRDLVARYNANGDAGRFEAVLELFAADAWLEVPPHRYRGRDEIRSLFEGAAGASAEAERIFHHTATLQIDVEGQMQASGRCYFQVLTEQGLDHWGRYRDSYRCEDGHWRFASRRVSVDGSVPGGWAARREGKRFGG